MFKISDYVVYKNNVCEVKEIKHDDYFDKDFYILYPIDDDSLKIQVPTSNKNVKAIISKEEAINLIDSIPSESMIESSGKVSELDYRKYLGTGEKSDLIKVIKTSYYEIEIRRKDNKKEREIDIQYFDKSINLLCNELAISMNEKFDNVKEFVIEKLSF